MRIRLRQVWRRVFPPRRVVTLEINSTSLRLMETKGARVAKWASQAPGPDMFENEVVTNPRGLSLVIRQLLASNDIKTRKITASISGLFSLTRIISVATSPPGSPVTQEAVLEKAKEVLPISEEELYLSWQTIDTAGDERRVLVTGVPRNIVDGEVRALRAAGTNPHVLELKAMALIRAVNREPALILNIETTTIDIVLVTAGVAQNMHTTAWQPAGLSLDDMAEHLAVALELTVGAYNSNHPGAELNSATPLFITGGMSGDHELAAAVHARVAYPLEPLSPPMECPPHLPVSQYAVNIGLASREIAAGKKSGAGGHLPLMMNLLPQIYRPRRPSAKQVYLFFAITAIITLLFPAYNLITEVSAKTTNLKTRYTVGKSEMERRQSELARREPLQKFLVTYKTIVEMGGSFIEDMQVITDKAKEFGIEVPTISHSGGSISITAEADSYTAFRDYTAALQESGRFASVTRPSERFPYLEDGTITLTPKK